MISTTLPSAGATTRPGFVGHPPRRIAEEVDDQPQHRARHECHIPITRDGHRGQRQQRPAHQLQFGQPPAGKRQPAAPAERVVGRVPMARAAVAAIFQVAGIEDFVRRAGGVAMPEGGHAPDIARPKMLEPPTSPASPGQFDAVAHSSARLHDTKFSGSGCGSARGGCFRGSPCLYLIGFFPAWKGGGVARVAVARQYLFRLPQKRTPRRQGGQPTRRWKKLLQSLSRPAKHAIAACRSWVFTLPSEMGKCLVGVGHAVDILALGHGRAFAVVGGRQLGRQLLAGGRPFFSRTAPESNGSPTTAAGCG